MKNTSKKDKKLGNENAAGTPNFAETKKSKAGISRVFNALKYSIFGFKAAFKHEHAFRQEIFAFAILTILICTFPLSFASKILLFLPFPLILAVEMLNSAIEAVVDDISLEFRERAKRAKDLGSAAVFCAMTIGVLTWIAVLANAFFEGNFDAWINFAAEIFAGTTK